MEDGRYLVEKCSCQFAKNYLMPKWIVWRGTGAEYKATRKELRFEVKCKRGTLKRTDKDSGINWSPKTSELTDCPIS